MPQLLDHLARAQQQRLREREITGKPSAEPATSSMIRTGQGVEVIVPNADLASKQVTNWTLYDRARRYEIDVGVEYGSDPSRVLRLLEDAAGIAIPFPQRDLHIRYAPAGIDMAATLKT